MFSSRPIKLVLVVSIVLGCMLALNSDAFGQASADKAVVEQLEAKIVIAYQKADTQMLDTLLAPDYVSVSGVGLVRNKQEILQDVKQGLISFTQVTDVAKQVKMYGDVAVVIGDATVEATDSGKAINGKFRVMRVWKKVGTRWRVIAAQTFAGY